MKKFLSLSLAFVLIVQMIPIYTISVNATTNKAEQEPNNLPENATSIETNETVIGTIGSGDIDYYTYTVSDTGYFVFSFLAYDHLEDDPQYSVTIYDSNMNVLEYYDAIKKLVSKKYNYKKGTQVHVSVKGKWASTDYSKNGTRHYSLEHKMTQTEDWELEDNDSRDTATVLNGKTYGTMLHEKDKDFFEYKALKNGTLSFDFVNEAGVTDTNGWHIRVYDKDLSEIAWCRSVSSDLSFGDYVVNKGTVLYLKVECSGTEIIDKEYSLTPKFSPKKCIETESNNVVTKATPVKIAKAYLGALNSVSDEDYYKFKATSNGKYTINVNINNTILEYGYELNVYNSSKKLLKKISAFTNNAKAKIRVKKGKTYYIQIKHYATQSIQKTCNRLYTIKVAR